MVSVDVLMISVDEQHHDREEGTPSPSLISLMVSVDVSVYGFCGPNATWKRRRNTV